MYIGGWGERVRQHPQLGNRFVSFVRATRRVPILCLCRSGANSVEGDLYLLSLSPSACIFYLLGLYLLSSGLSIFPCEFSKKVRKGRFPSEFSKRVHKELLKRGLEESSQKEFLVSF